MQNALARWVIDEALSAIGLAATEPAASALLNEGLRRCELLLPTSTDNSNNNNTTPLATIPTAGSGSSTSEAAQVETQPRPSAAAPSGGDGWDLGDDVDFDDSTATTSTAAGGPVSSTSDGGGSGGRSAREEREATAGAPGPARTESARVGDDSGVGEDVARLRARLVSLRDLVETFLAVDGAQGLAFDVVRLREFLALAAGPGESGGEQGIRHSSDRLLLPLRRRCTYMPPRRCLPL